MYCPKCGKSDQTINSYCRQCGLFLPDFDKIRNSQTTPEQHLTANLVLNFMTAIASATLAILLYYFFLGKAETPVIIYVTAGFLTAMFAWQVQIIIRTFFVRKHLKNLKNPERTESELRKSESAPTKKLLEENELINNIPLNISHNTENLKKKVIR